LFGASMRLTPLGLHEKSLLTIFSIGNPSLNDDLSTIITFPGEISGLTLQQDMKFVGLLIECIFSV